MSIQPVFEYHSEASCITIELPDGNIKNITIEPGYAFGTGNHITTKLCLRLIEKHSKYRKFKSVLDIGCGSGILAIASALLCADRVTAIDIVPLTINEAQKNISKNNLSEKIDAFCTTIDTINESFELILANILPEEILSIKEQISSRLMENSILILCGIKNHEKDTVVDNFSVFNVFLEDEISKDDWCALLFSKK